LAVKGRHQPLFDKVKAGELLILPTQPVAAEITEQLYFSFQFSAFNFSASLRAS
jgi:hypothetical protein